MWLAQLLLESSPRQGAQSSQGSLSISESSSPQHLSMLLKGKSVHITPITLGVSDCRLTLVPVLPVSWASPSAPLPRSAPHKHFLPQTHCSLPSHMLVPES